MIRVIALFACCVLLSSPAIGGKPDEATAKDLKAMVGKWKIEKAVLSGTDAIAFYKGLTVEITEEGKYMVALGELKDLGKLALDPSRKPAAMDITGTKGPNKDKTVKAIYKIEGDTLTICYATGGDARPAKFESKPDSKQFLVVYKREKK